MFRSNLTRVLDQARRDDWQLGRLSWVRYNHLLREIASRHHTTLEIAAGVFSALSPNNDYLGNCRDANTLILASQTNRTLDDFKVTTYGSNKRKAWAIALGGHPLDHLRYPKTRNFYLNLVDPMDPDPVTIDGHIYNVWTGTRVNLNSAASRFNPKMYGEIAEGIRQIATERGELANVIQATLWHCWKRVHRIRYDAQLHFWGPDYLIAGLGFILETDLHTQHVHASNTHPIPEAPLSD